MLAPAVLCYFRILLWHILSLVIGMLGMIGTVAVFSSEFTDHQCLAEASVPGAKGAKDGGMPSNAESRRIWSHGCWKALA